MVYAGVVFVVWRWNGRVMRSRSDGDRVVTFGGGSASADWGWLFCWPFARSVSQVTLIPFYASISYTASKSIQLFFDSNNSYA